MARNTAKPQPPSPPEIADERRLATLAEGALRSSGRYDGLVLSGGDYSKSDLRGLALESAVLGKVIARAACWRELHLSDVRLAACDLANVDCRGASCHRVEMLDSRLTGANLSRGRFLDLRIVNCKADAAWFIRSVFERVRFERCDLHGANFEGADLRHAVFSDCDLRQARLSGARLDGADLRGSLLNNITAAPGDLRGAVIEPAQAPDLIALLGVILHKREDRD